MAAGVHDAEGKRRSCFRCHFRHSSWPWEETLNSHTPYHRQFSMESKEGQHRHWKAACNTQLRAYVGTACIWTRQVNPLLVCFQRAQSLRLNKPGCRITCPPDLVTVAKWRLKDSKPSNVTQGWGSVSTWATVGSLAWERRYSHFCCVTVQRCLHCKTWL